MSRADKTAAGCLFVILGLILAIAIYVIFGHIMAWILLFFGVKIPWFVYSVSLAVLFFVVKVLKKA